MLRVFVSTPGKFFALGLGLLLLGAAARAGSETLNVSSVNSGGNFGDTYNIIINSGETINFFGGPFTIATGSNSGGTIDSGGSITFTSVTTGNDVINVDPTTIQTLSSPGNGSGVISFTTIGKPVPPPPGTYFGIVHGDSLDSSGTVRAVLNRFGRGSVSVKLGDEKTCVAQVGPYPILGGGPIVVGGPYFPIVTFQPNPPMKVQLYTILLPQGGTGLTGTVIEDGKETTVTLVRAAPPQDAASLAGQYTVILDKASAGSAFSADVAGVGTVRVTRKGRIDFLGYLSDGTLVTQTSSVNSDGAWPLFIKKKNGMILSGDVVFADESQTDLAGSIHLQTPGAGADPTDTDTPLDLAGSRYNPTLAWMGASTWTLTTSEDQGATVAFTHELNPFGNLLLSTALNWGSRSGAGAYLDQKTGLVAGGYAGGVLDAHALLGVVFQKTGAAFGFTQSLEGLIASGSLGSLGLLDPASLSNRHEMQRALSTALAGFHFGTPGIFAITEGAGNTTTTFGGTSINLATGAGSLNTGELYSGATLSLAGVGLTFGGSLNGNLNLTTSGSLYGSTNLTGTSTASGSLIVTGSGSLNLTGTGAFSGTGAVLSGSIGTGSLLVTNGATLTFDTVDATTFTDLGTLNLTGAETINVGTLFGQGTAGSTSGYVDRSTGSLDGTLTLSSGATFTSTVSSTGAGLFMYTVDATPGTLVVTYPTLEFQGGSVTIGPGSGLGVAPSSPPSN